VEFTTMEVAFLGVAVIDTLGATTLKVVVAVC